MKKWRMCLSENNEQEQLQFGAYRVMTWREYGQGYPSSNWFVVNMNGRILENCCRSKESAKEYAKLYDAQDIKELEQRMDDLLTVPDSK